MENKVWWLITFLLCIYSRVNAYTVEDITNTYKKYGEPQTNQILQTIGNCTPDEANSLIKIVQMNISLNEKNTVTEPNTLQQKNSLLVGHVIAVVNNNTIKIDINDTIMTFRPIGIDIPESLEPYTKITPIFLKNLLVGETVYIEYDPLQGEKNGYDYSFAYIYRYPDGLFINAEIIRQGYGKCNTKYLFKYMALFQSFEDTARKTPKGLWKIEDYPSQTIKPITDPPTPKNTNVSMPNTRKPPSSATEYETSYGESNSSGMVYVHGYYRKNGTYVHGYYRRKPRR